MTAEERSSLARAKRASIIVQRAIDVLGSTEAAYYWLASPCPALHGKAPAALRFDIATYRRTRDALRRRELRARAVRAATIGFFVDERAYSGWLWSRCRALTGRLPAMLLDSDRGTREVLRAIREQRAHPASHP